VDSYLWYGGGLKKGFEKATEMQKQPLLIFPNLLEMVALAQPKLRIPLFHFQSARHDPLMWSEL